MTLRLLTALEPRHEAGIVAALGAVPGAQLVRRCPDLADLIAASSAGLADVALVSSRMRGLDRDGLAQLTEAGVRVVGVVDDDEAEERRLRQLGVAQIVGADGAPDELAVVLERLGTAAASADPGRADPKRVDPARAGPAVSEFAAVEAGLPLPPQAAGEDEEAAEPAGRIIAVWGPTGAPGRTSVAVNLAAELALQERSVLLIDADTYGACVGQVLGLIDEAPGIAAAARTAELGTLDLPTLARLAPVVDPGFRVLTGLPSSGRWPEVRADSMNHILELARRMAEIVVVDCGFCIEDDEELSYDTRAPRRNAATVATIAAADEILAVGAGDPIGLQRLVRAIQELSRVSAHPPRIVVTRVRASVAGGAPERRVAEVLDRFAGVRVDVVIPDDRAGFDRCLMSGRLLYDVAPKSPARARLRTLATSLAEGCTEAAPGRAGRIRAAARGRRLRR